jgi:hypothetical protein
MSMLCGADLHRQQVTFERDGPGGRTPTHASARQRAQPALALRHIPTILEGAVGLNLTEDAIDIGIAVRDPKLRSAPTATCSPLRTSARCQSRAAARSHPVLCGTTLVKVIAPTPACACEGAGRRYPGSVRLPVLVDFVSTRTVARRSPPVALLRRARSSSSLARSGLVCDSKHPAGASAPYSAAIGRRMMWVLARRPPGVRRPERRWVSGSEKGERCLTGRVQGTQTVPT